MKLEVVEIESPLGEIRVVAGPGGVCDLDFAARWEVKRARLERRFGPLVIEPGDPLHAARRLRAYFGGRLAAFDDLPIDPGGTDFQRSVWDALRRIPAGETRSYAELAAAIGRANAPRPVGGASGRNPIAIVVPCHRLIGSDGSLTGYAGGTWRKRWLLVHEGALGEQAEIALPGEQPAEPALR
jgi:methylated-DNA-[protein]-cysteine S-methyltransferase